MERFGGAEVAQSDMERLMQEERLHMDEVWVGERINPIESMLEMELTDRVPGMERAIVVGDPYAWGEKLDFQQGFDNPYGAFGTCAPTSIANLCTMAGMELTEPEVVTYAMENGLSAPVRPGELGGATTIGGQLEILAHYGFDAHCEFNDAADCERVAELIEGGHGVICGLNSGVLQDRPWKTYNEAGEICATHSVCMTATVRDADTGALRGFYLCDSSAQRPDGAMIFVPLEKMQACYGDIKGGFVVATDAPIR